MEHLTEYQIFEYISGEPDSESITIMEAHLNNCAVCRNQIQEYREDLTSIETGFPEEPSDIFWINYLPKLRQLMTESDVNEPGFVSNLASAFSGILVAAVIFTLLAGWFPENVVDLQFEEWFADNLTNSYIYYYDEDYFNDIYTSEMDLQQIDEILPDDNIFDILESINMDELEEALSIIKDETII